MVSAKAVRRDCQGRSPRLEAPEASAYYRDSGRLRCENTQDGFHEREVFANLHIPILRTN
jgi:hypothetical protein